MRNLKRPLVNFLSLASGPLRKTGALGCKGLDIDHQTDAALDVAAMFAKIRQVNIPAPVAPTISKHVGRSRM